MGRIVIPYAENYPFFAPLSGSSLVPLMALRGGCDRAAIFDFFSANMNGCTVTFYLS